MKRDKNTDRILRDARAGGSHTLLSARLASGAGKHGGSARAKNRRDRQSTRRELRSP